MNRTITLLAFGLAAGAMVLIVGLASAAGAAPGPLLSDDDATSLGIVVDEQGSAAIFGISAAIVTANSVLHPSPTDVAEVHHGLASEYANTELRSVWVVIYRGGEMMAFGPPGAKPGTPRYRGAIVDDTTGAFIRGFLMWTPAQ